MGYGAIIAALVGAAGSIGGGALAGEQAKTKDRNATQLQSSSLANQVATLALLSRLGYAPETEELLLQSSPVQQSLNRRFATPVSRETRRRLLDVSQWATDTLISARDAGDNRGWSDVLFATTRGTLTEPAKGLTFGGKSHAALERLAQDGGFRDVGEMLESEIAYRRKIPQLMAQQKQSADQQRQLQELATGEQISALQAMGSVGDVATHRDSERARLLRDLDLQQQSVLAAANAGGFNPSGGLEALSRARSDADIEALNRAIAMATGQTAIATQRASTAKSLDPTLIALGLAPNLSGQTTTSSSSSGGSAGFGQGVQSAGIIGAGGILEAIDMYNRRKQAPATSYYSTPAESAQYEADQRAYLGR